MLHNKRIKILLTLAILIISVSIFNISCAKTSANDYYKYGVKFYNARNYKKAIEYFKTAISLDSKNYNSMYYLAMSYQQDRQYKIAAQTYLKLAMAAPNEPQGKQAKIAMMTLGQQIKTLKAQGKLTPEMLQQFKSPVNSSMLTGSLGKNQTAYSSNTRVIQNFTNNSVKSTSADPRDILPERTKIEFTKIRGNHSLFQVLVNNHPIDFMLDSGAEICCISKQILEKAGITPPSGPPNGTQVAGVGSNGTVPTWSMKVTMKVGGIEKHNFPLSVIDSESLEYPLLGQTFIKGYQVSVDNTSSLIRLVKNTNSMNLGTAVKFTRSGNEIIVVANVNGKDVPMIFDTGASNIAFPANIAKQLNLSIDPDGQVGIANGVAGVSRSFPVKLKQFKLGPIQLYDFPATISETSNMGYPLLGQSVFGDGWEYVIDDKENVIRFIRR